jgi:hypothetical protein
MLITGAGLRLTMSPLNTDALDRVGLRRCGDASGIMFVAFLIALAFMPAGRETATE